MASITQPVVKGTGATARIPWYLWCLALAVTSVTIGGRWDVSWHMSIGRDTFWTPAHMAIYLCGVLAGIVCGYLVLNATFRRPPELVASSVHVLGLRTLPAARMSPPSKYIRAAGSSHGYCSDGRKDAISHIKAETAQSQAFIAT